MTDKENASISFEEVWKSLEEQDKTGEYKRAREMAGIAREQLEYAFNYGYETAKAKYSRPQGEFTDLERKVIADSINYLLGAELLEENGYTEEVINALKSVLQKIGAEENHL